MTPTPERPGDGMLRTGGFILVAGMLATVVAMAPLVSDIELPSLFWWLAVMLVASGLGLVILGLFRNGLGRSRMQRAARAPLDS